MQRVTTRNGIASLAFVSALFWAPLAVAQPSEQLAELNDLWVTIPDEDRSDLVLLPALASMDAPPPAASSIPAAALLTPDSDSWSSVESWATAPAQVATLDALKTVSERRSRFVFAQPYGDNVGNAAKDAGLWTDLGNPPLLANASFGWIEPLSALGALVQVEATRLGAAGDVTEAMNLVTSWIRFARSFADRQFQDEVSTALSWMIFGMERLRDLAYLYGDGVDGVELRAVIRELDERELNIARLRLPKGHRLAAEELLAMTFIERGGPNPDTFGRVFAQLETGDRPMRLFAEAARWQRLADQHADYFSTVDELESAHSDWSLRWDVTPFDLIWNQAPHYERIDSQRHALITNVVPNAMELFEQRRALRTEIAGTRLALAIVGYEEWGGGWPDPVFAVRPRFISEIPIDPWNPAEDEPLQFFVPIRDLPSSERVQPGPHEMTIHEWQAHLSPEGLSAGAANRAAMMSVLGGDAASAAERVSAAMNIDMIRGQILGLLNGVQAGVITQASIPEIAETVANARASGGRQVTAVDRGMMTMFGALEAEEGEPYTTEEFKQLLESYFTDLLNAPATSEALTTLRAGRQPSDAQVRAVFEACLVSLVTRQFEVETGSSLETESDASFSRTFDATQFILYSVGFDGIAQRAEQVGPGGTDILIWPPMLSLIRDQLNNN